MVKIQFGSGENILEGWTNLQESSLGGDITKPLMFGDGIVDFILAEHVVEHVTHRQAWHFFCECHRVLKSGGVARILVPDVAKIASLAQQDYFDFIRQGAKRWYHEARLPWADKPVTKKEAVQTIIFCHGHQACWTEEMLRAILNSLGFVTGFATYGNSIFPELQGVDGHWKMMGLDRCRLESCVVEAQKL